VVVNEVVVWVCDPETTGRSIGVEETPRSLSHRNKVSMNLVVSLNCVLDEDIVTHSVVDDIVSNSEIACTVHGEGSVETGIDGVSNDVGLVHVTDHMEMDGISTQLESLSHVAELNIAQASLERVITDGMEEDSCSVLVGL